MIHMIQELFGQTLRQPASIDVVMAGLVPAIHVFLSRATKDVDARDKRGYDELCGAVVTNNSYRTCGSRYRHER
jgi:hypothetical protein